MLSFAIVQVMKSRPRPFVKDDQSSKERDRFLEG